jgi:predicted dehydrogenase
MRRSASRPPSLVLVGIGGMGACYLRELLDHDDEASFRLAGAVDPEPRRCPDLAELERRRVPVFGALEEFYAARRADLAVISSPIQFHARQVELALASGSHVLCEKPAAAVIQDVEAMIRARRRAGRMVAVGFQWSFSEAVRKLKDDILAGRLGRPRRLRCLYLWPRDESYYRRNGWAGRVRDAGGRWVLDGPAMNAMGHDLHNMLYVLGASRDRSARPVTIRAELYRAHDIDNCDTAACRLRTSDGAEILFYVSHAVDVDLGPVIRYEFDGGTVFAAGREASLTACLAGGGLRRYGRPDAAPFNKLWTVIELVRSGTGRPACGLEAASAQVLAVNGMQESSGGVGEFPPALVKRRGPAGKRLACVRGLPDVLWRCFEEGRLPSEAGAPWARPGRTVSLEGYSFFPEPRR